MSDDKQQTRAKLLNELESIKTLLKEEAFDLEPPILTTAIDDIADALLLTAPLLTEALDDDLAVADESIPVLQEAVELAAAEISLERESESEAEPEVDAEAEPQADAEPQSEPGPLSQADLEQDTQQNTSTTTATLSTEDQQRGLFDAAAEPPATPDSPEAPDKAASATLSSGRGENPFLPRHIRERIAANRRQQSEMMGAFTQRPAQTPTQEPAATDTSAQPETPATHGPSEQQLVDEMVQRFLPAIEAALRERLEALIRDQAKTPEDNDH